MVRPISTSFVSFLDRFEERMQVDCERLKRQLISQVDGQFGVLLEKVAQLRNQFGCGGMPRSARSAQVELPDDPPVENVSLEQYIQERTVSAQSELASTSTGRKRKSTSQSGNETKKRKPTPNRKHFCKFVGCGRSFDLVLDLIRHERIHLKIKPYFCAWSDCKCTSAQRPTLVKHIRSVHFKLPRSVKEQNELNMIDDRDPNEFVRVDQQLANRRL